MGVTTSFSSEGLWETRKESQRERRIHEKQRGAKGFNIHLGLCEGLNGIITSIFQGP